MRALVFGAATGQVARELLLAAPGRGIDATALGRADADLADPAACARAVHAAAADVVVNAAAYTAVDRAEDEPALADVVNAAAPGAMAVAAAEKGVPFLHVSTDYVFDGAPGRPWREDDPTGPLGAYGASKLAGERAIAAAGGDFVILRTAWVFASHGRNFVKTMLAAGRGRDEMGVVGDQRGGPTPARDIAAALWTIAAARVAGSGAPGVYHFSGAPAVCWAEFAEAIFARSGWAMRPKVTRTATGAWPTSARRPANSVLDCGKIAAAYGIAQPDWRVGLDAVIGELQGAEA
jgi:dTDP-4-dehydrorhamnose reductase